MFRLFLTTPLCTRDAALQMSARDHVLAWCRQTIGGRPGVVLNNFGECWYEIRVTVFLCGALSRKSRFSGVNFLALVDALTPGTTVKPNALESSSAKTLLDFAFRQADRLLGVPPLLSARNVANGLNGEREIMVRFLFHIDDTMLKENVFQKKIDVCE